MKNLKRVLSLALSGIMLVGMMAVSAGAVNAEDFTDADEITHTEAVSISTALKIIDGKEDGSFDPDGFVTRGQMAKMITRAMFGGEDPVLGLPGTPSFTDIKGRWDETYIEYCANNTIINGRGDGTFDPEGNVTGTEAAKMLLTALGYKADIYGLVGPDWAITTNSIANQTKVALYGGLKGLDPSKPFTRDQVAQMIYNALNANTREMNPNMSITNGNVTYAYEDSKRSLLYDKYGAVRVEGVVTKNEFTENSDAQKGKTTVKISNDDELEEELDLGTGTLVGTPKLAVSSGREEFGRAVIVYVKPASTNKKDLSKGTVICDVIVDPDMNTVETTTDSTSKTMEKWLDGKGLDLVATAGSPNADSTVTVWNTNYGTADAAFDKDYKNSVGTEIIAIDNDADGEVEYMLQNTYAFGQVSKYNTKDKGSVTVRTVSQGALAPSNKELANVVAYEDVKVDDYVMTTLVDKTYYLTKCETVNGTLDAYENLTKAEEDDDELITVAKTKTMTVDGDKRKVNQSTSTYEAGGLKAVDKVAKPAVLKEDVTIYLDNFGYIVAGDANAASDWLFVANAALNDQATGLSSATLTAYVYMQDGTAASYVVDEYTIKDASGADDKSFDRFTKSGNHDQDIKGGLFKYTVKNNGHLILESAETVQANPQADKATDHSTQNQVTFIGTAADEIDYNKDLSKLTLTDADSADNDDVKYVTMDTVVFFVTLKDGGTDIDKVRVYDQKNAPSMNYHPAASQSDICDGATSKFYAGVKYVTTAESSRDLDAVVFVNDEAKSSDWLYLIDYVETVDEGRIYNAIIDGEVKQITANDKRVRAVPNAYGYSMDGDLYDIDNGTYKLSFVGEVTYVDNKSVIIKNPADPAGVEARFTKSTITALLDSDETTIDVGITKGDIVALVTNEDPTKVKADAEAVFIITEYDDTKSAVVYTDPTLVTDKGSNTYEVSEVALKAAYAASNATVEQVMEQFVFSGKSKVKVIKKDATVTACPDGTKAYNDSDYGTAATGNIAEDDVCYVLVQAESVGNADKNSSGKYIYSAYTINVVA